MAADYDPAEVEKQAFAPGWEKEHAVDHADYLDSLMDPEDPFHEKVVEAAQQDRAGRKKMTKAVKHAYDSYLGEGRSVYGPTAAQGPCDE